MASRRGHLIPNPPPARARACGKFDSSIGGDSDHAPPDAGSSVDTVIANTGVARLNSETKSKVRTSSF
jgi:hypothetical protein